MKRFRFVLPVAQSVLALTLGGIGEWQRCRILNQPTFFGDGWHSTARFHEWPWPLKFAVITNMPTSLPAGILLLPLPAEWQDVAGAIVLVLAILSGPLFWYWISSRFDRRWTLKDRKPWLALAIFNLVALTGALLDLGTVGYIPFGFVLWILWATMADRLSRRLSKPVIVRTGAVAGE